jgi:hypothetical protein
LRNAYNFVRIHQTLRVTLAMASGVFRVWEIADIVKSLEERGEVRLEREAKEERDRRAFQGFGPSWGGSLWENY